MHYHIGVYRIKNFKGLKDLEVNPGEARIIQFTGPSGAGKTSAIEGLMFLLDGKTSLPDRQAINNEAHNLVGEIEIIGRDGQPGKLQYTITRTLSDRAGDRGDVILVNNLTGKREFQAQEMLDGLFSRISLDQREKRRKLAFDPLEFLGLSGDQQATTLMQLMGSDPEKDRELDQADEEARKPINAELKYLEAEKAKLTGQTYEGLPAKPIDIEAITQKLNAAGAENEKQRQIGQAKQDLGAAAAKIGIDKKRNLEFIEDQKAKIAELERQLNFAKQGLAAAQDEDKRLAKEHVAAEKAYQNAPEAKYVDVAELGQQILGAQRVNAAIQNRVRFDALAGTIKEKQAAADALTDQIAQRKRQREQAIKDAKLPVEGLTLETWTVGTTEKPKSDVLYKGRPLKNLSEGEQIRISAEIIMALSPKLRVMFIRRGESLDQKGYDVLEKLAVKYDFQIWMAKLDTSESDGLVLEEGRVKLDARKKPAAAAAAPKGKKK